MAAKRKDTEDQQKTIRTSRRKSKSSNKKKITRIFKHQDKKIEERRVNESVAEYYERIGRMKSGPASKTNGLGDFSKYKLKVALKPFAADENEVLYFK